MTERLNHKLDVSKIQTLEDVKNIFDTISLVISMSEDDPRYEMAKEYFTIPYTPEPLVLTSWEKVND